MRCRVADNSFVAEPFVWRNAGAPAPTPGVPGRELVRAPEMPAADPEELMQLRAQLAQSEQRRQFEVQQARQDGFNDGVRQARSEGEVELRAAMERVTNTLTELATTKRRIRNDAEAELLKLSLAIARRVIHREIALDPEALAGVVHAALQKLQTREVSRVRVFPAAADSVRLAIERAGGPTVEVFPDPSLRTGDLLFETSLGQLDASVESQLQEIGRGLADRLALR
jgi:flagellar assembly protein FliH